jgi:hypothetical protein
MITGIGAIGVETILQRLLKVEPSCIFVKSLNIAIDLYQVFFSRFILFCVLYLLLCLTKTNIRILVLHYYRDESNFEN